MVEIREERPTDIAAIRAVNEAAFGRTEESGIVDALRANDAFTLSLVASMNGLVVGHILFSPVAIGAVSGAGLAPMAVLPAHQRQGIGSQLVQSGVSRLRASGCPFIVVLGHPGFYPRFGFRQAADYGVSCEWDVPSEVFMLALFEPALRPRLSGTARYREEFSL